MPDERGRFGEFGGQYVPETLMSAIEELEIGFNEAIVDTAFQSELAERLADFAGRETPLTFAENLSREIAGAQIYLKREDLVHTGAHKLNNALGQALLAKRMGKQKLVAETGAGQHGVATATVAAKFGMECLIYMGEEDMKRQQLNVLRMELLGATVIPAVTGSKTLKDATNEAIRHWVAHAEDTFYLIGSVVGHIRILRLCERFNGLSVMNQENNSSIKPESYHLQLLHVSVEVVMLSECFIRFWRM